MHILHVSPYFAPAYSFGGVVSMLEGLTAAQVAQGHRVTVLTTDAYSLEQRFEGQLQETHHGVQVIRCRNTVYPLRRYNLSTPFAMRAHAQAIMSEVDVVHLHEFRTVENLLMAPIASKHQVPMVLSPHGTLTYSTGRSVLKSWWDRLLSPQVAAHIAHVMALADSERMDVQQTWRQFDNLPEISIVPNGVDLERYQQLPNATTFRERYGLGDATVILFMGRLHQRKGVDVLARAFQQATLPNAKLLLVGPNEGMRSAIETLGNKNIILTGFLSGDERLAAFAAADVFALPAIGEGLSMAVLEAMACGLPVLLSEGCNLPEAFAADAGYKIEVDVDGIAQILDTIIRDREALSEMGRNAQHLVRERFTWDRIVAQMTVIYKDLVD